MVETQVSARDLFRTAYENRYTWDSSFPGYTADVTFTSGDTTGRLRFIVSAALLKIRMDLTPFPTVRPWKMVLSKS